MSALQLPHEKGKILEDEVLSYFFNRTKKGELHFLGAIKTYAKEIEMSEENLRDILRSLALDDLIDRKFLNGSNEITLTKSGRERAQEYQKECEEEALGFWNGNIKNFKDQWKKIKHTLLWSSTWFVLGSVFTKIIDSL